ncbi:MAG: putative anti-sigma factor [Chloroflexi bacterium]|nr:putative anti-sigma factor [Chloroflexota bacterium]
MRCSDLGELLSSYVDGQTVPAQTEFIEAHLGTCQRCQDLVRHYRRTRAIIQFGLDDRWTPPDLGLRVVHACQQQHTCRRPLSTTGIMAATAALVVLVASLLATHAFPQWSVATGSSLQPAPKVAARHDSTAPHDVPPTIVHCPLRFAAALARCLGVSPQWVPTILADEPGILVSNRHIRNQPSIPQIRLTSASAVTAVKGGGARVGNAPSHRGSQAI